MKKQKFLLLLSFLIHFIYGYAQTFEEMRFPSPIDKPEIKITGLLVRSTDDKNNFRLRAYDSITKKQSITLFQLKTTVFINKSGIVDSFYWITKPINEKLIKGNLVYTTKPNAIILKRNPLGIYKPWKSIIYGSDTVIVDFLEPPKTISKNKLSIQLVENYFNETEPLYAQYKNLIRLNSANKAIQNPVLHVVIVADLFDEKIGEGCSKDLKNLVLAYSLIAKKINIPLDTLIVSGDSYSRKGVELALSSLEKKANSNDVIMFHYTGHGFNRNDDDDPDPFPNFFLIPDKDKKQWESSKYKAWIAGIRKETMSASDIYTAIVEMGARLNGVFSDCCNGIDFTLSNNVLDDTTVIEPMVQSRGFIDMYQINCKMLFLEQKASFLSIAAQKGELSASLNDIGSLFTFNYLETLYSFLAPGNILSDDDVNWTKLLQSTNKKSTMPKFAKFKGKVIPNAMTPSSIIR